jgi:EpsI family protein
LSRLRWFVSCALLLGAAAYLHLFAQGEQIPMRQSLDVFPTTVGRWNAVETVPLDAETLEVLKPSDYLIRRYQDSSGRDILLYIGYWQTQRKGAEIHSPKNCLPGGGWEPLEANRLHVDLGNGREGIDANRYVLQKGSEAMMVLYWYQSQGRAVAGELAAKLDLVRNAIFKNRSDGAIVRISAPVQGTIAQTSELLSNYAKDLYPVLDGFLPS